MAQQQPLHPNLARLAAAYDDIVARFGRNEITAPEARGRIAALTARDDTGVMWSIDPDTAEWRFQTRTGELQLGKPPTYGLATPTAFDLSHSSGAFNPDERINFYEVDENLLYPPSSLSGSTRRRPTVVNYTFMEKYFSETKQRLIAVAVLLILILLAYLLF